MFSISRTNLTKDTPPRVPFSVIAKTILGTDYELSLVFVNSKKSREINRTHRGKDKPTNILSFPINNNTGEIFIDIELCKKECIQFDRTYTNFIAFLFIHGLLHLKGYDHSSTMEHKERQYRKKFGI